VTEIRSFHHSAFPPARLRDERDGTISVCVPARECAATIAHTVRELVGLVEEGAIDEVVVVDAASADGTAELARDAGARVVQEVELLPSFGPVLGKGDAMWRGLSVLKGDVVCFVDGDSAGFGAHFARGLAGTVACEPGVSFCKAAYRRPFRVGDVELPDGGGRVSQLTARPLLTMFYPELAAIRQPLAGEMAARRELLKRLPFATGYAVETAMLIDAYLTVGIDAIAQCDLDERVNPHQSLAALTPMAWAVLHVVTERLRREGRLSDVHPGALLVPEGDDLVARGFELVERPPLQSVAT
jgi:glucosyl-3-phosphoglycerate synthase